MVIILYFMRLQAEIISSAAQSGTAYGLNTSKSCLPVSGPINTIDDIVNL